MLLSRRTRPWRRAPGRHVRSAGPACSIAAAVLATGLVAPAPAGAQLAGPGRLDTTFGGDGIATTEVSPSYDAAEALVVQPDGKLVAAGFTDAANPASEYDRDFALTRHNPDGSLDTSFGGDGIVTTDFVGGGDEAHALVLQPDGKLVAAGEAAQPFRPETGAPSDFALARYNPDGSLDTTFGGDGTVTTDFDGPSDEVQALALQPDGKLVAVGTVGGAGLARYNPDGTLDTTFGNGGRLSSTAAGGLYEASAVALQPDGKVVIAGYGYNTGMRGIALARFNPDGTRDGGFGNGGTVVTLYFWGDSRADALLVRRDGTLLVGGSAALVIPNGRATVRFPDDYALVRYLPNGSVDWTFGYFGWAVTDFDGQADQVKALLEQPDGRIVAAGGSGSWGAFRMARYAGTGALDPTFGSGGRVSTASGGAEAIVRQADGKLVTAGVSYDFASEPLPQYNDFALLRFHGTP